jgi:plasmid segregation protein ParM
MSKIKGLDHGYLYTKDNEKRIFRSAFTKSGLAMGATSFITINGVDHSVGTGNRTISFDKTDSDMNEVGTLTMLAMDGDNDYYLVVGLPISQYQSQKDKFKKMIMGYNDREVIYRGKKMDIKINDVYVLPQGVGALLSLDELKGNIVIFDFGGLTIDIASIEIVYGNPVLKKYDTWTEGIQKIYSRVVNAVNEKYNLTLDVSEAENILVNGLTLYGEKVSTDFLEPVLRQYLDPILTNFKVNFTDINSQVYLCGGSAIIFESLFKTHFPHARLMYNSQFANAIGYHKCGLQKYGHLCDIKPQPICRR